MPIDVETRGHVAVVTLNRPERLNALDADHYRALSQAFVALRDDVAIRAVIVTGAGERAFSTGADLKAPMNRFTPEETMRFHSDPLPNRGLEFTKPLIAAVNGHCLAGGLCLALACDIRLATPLATFGLTEVRRGLIAGNGGTYRLARQLPAPIAMEMLLTGASITADAAERWGLVNRIVAPDALLEEAHAVADRIAANAPLAVQAAKELAVRVRDHDAATILRLEQTLLAALYATEDRIEGAAAFVEKRAPRFQGR